MKKTARTDSQADAVAAVLLVMLVVAFAVVWVSGQQSLLAGKHQLDDHHEGDDEADRKQNSGDDVWPGTVA